MSEQEAHQRVNDNEDQSSTSTTTTPTKQTGPLPVAENQQQQQQQQQQESVTSSSSSPHKHQQQHLHEAAHFVQEHGVATFVPVFETSESIEPKCNESLRGQVPWKCAFCHSYSFGHHCKGCSRHRDEAALRPWRRDGVQDQLGPNLCLGSRGDKTLG